MAQESVASSSTQPSIETVYVPSRFPDWCESSPRFYTYVCEQFVSSPIWCSVFIADGVALWLIVRILLRQRQQDREKRNAKRELSRASRSRAAWSLLKTTTRLASMSLSKRHYSSWSEAWEATRRARADRKQYVVRRDFDISGLIVLAAGPVFQVLVLCIISFETHGWYTLVLPWWFASTPELRTAIGYVTSIVPITIYIFYALTCFTDPGSPGADAELESVLDFEVGTKIETKRCVHCRGPKPPRCHHCRVCRRCTLKMDHHCPFVNTCIGLRNYKYFNFFVMEASFGCGTLLLALVPEALDVVRRTGPAMGFPHRLHVMVVFVLAFLVSMGLLPFFCFHFQLILMNQTTLEFMKRRSIVAELKNGAKPVKIENYSRGSAVENYSEVCGPPSYCVRLCIERMMILTRHSIRLKRDS